MSAVEEQRGVDPLAHIPRFCACGCGEPVNVQAIRVLELRAFGVKLKDAAERVGISYASAKQAGRQIARFVVGHGTAGREYEDRCCLGCGGHFRIQASSDSRYCKQIGCGAETLDEWFQRNYTEFDRREAEKNAALRANTAVILADERERRARRRRFNAFLESGRELRLLRERPHRMTAEEWLDQQTGEVQALIAEQAKDRRAFQAQYEPSLDLDTFEDGDSGFRRHGALGAVHFDREDDEWLYYAARGRGSKMRATR